MRYRTLIFTMALWLLLILPIYAQQSEKPLSLPFNTPPSAETWLLGQTYGNTIGAYLFGDLWYSAGQGLHFGLDFSAPCGTPVIAMADGVVAFADNLSFGSRPHNLIVRHPNVGVTVLYGHLLDRPLVADGQTITRGQILGYTGDPDETCVSRPHLHLEVRSLDYRTALNPVDYIEADWHVIANMGSFSERIFQQDLDNSRRWMSIDEQPNVQFGGRRLNAYLAVNTPLIAQPSAPISRNLSPLPTNTTVNLRTVGFDTCCQTFWWNNTNEFFVIDGGNNQRATIARWDTQTAVPVEILQNAPRPIVSTDESLELSVTDFVTIRDIATGDISQPNTNGFVPTISPNNEQLLWVERANIAAPGQTQPISTIMLSDIQGENQRSIFSQEGASAQWLNSERILITINQRPYTALMVYETTTQNLYNLGRWFRLRNLSIAPGGEHVMFYLTNQIDSAQNGVYHVSTSLDATLTQMDWFGAWRWRDATTLYYIPFTPEFDTHQLHYFDIISGMDMQLSNRDTTPFTIMNGYWQVSADGNMIAFHDLTTRNLTFLDIITP